MYKGNIAVFNTLLVKDSEMFSAMSYFGILCFTALFAKDLLLNKLTNELNQKKNLTYLRTKTTSWVLLQSTLRDFR